MMRFLCLVLVAFAATPPLFAQEPGLLATLEGHSGDVRSIAFSPDGKTLASGSEDKTIKLWDVATAKNTATLTGHTATVRAVAFSRDGKLLASASDDKTVKLWDLAAGKDPATLTGHTDRVRAVAFSHDGKTLASGSLDKTIKLWEIATGKNTATFEGHPLFVSSVAFSPDRKTLACGIGGGAVRLWNLDAAKSTALCNDDDEYITPFVVFSPDGKTLASAARCNVPRQAVLLWDVATGRITAILKAHGAYGVAALAYTPNGKTLASVGTSGDIKLWDPVDGTNVATFNVADDVVSSAAFSPDGEILAIGTFKKTIKLWDFRAREIAMLSAVMTNGKWVKDLGSDEMAEHYVYVFANDGSYTSKLITDHGTPTVEGRWALSKGDAGRILLQLKDQKGQKNYYWLQETSEIRYDKKNDRLVVSGDRYFEEPTLRHDTGK